MRTSTRKVAQAVVLVAIGVALSPFTSFPIGIASVNPTQHFINVVGAILLGPWWAMTVAAIVGALRNALGVGTLLAFPGGMIGAIIAGYAYRYTRSVYLGMTGEIFGTGILGALVSGLLVAPVFMGQTMALTILIVSFLASALIGAVLGLIALKALERADYVDLDGTEPPGA